MNTSFNAWSNSIFRWRSNEDRSRKEFYTEIVQEGAPVCLNGHRNPIDILITDGHLILSQCLGGKILVWDSLTGEILSTIDR